LKTITVTYQMPDDMYAFEQAHHADLAWSAISQALTVIRNHIKHDSLTADEAITMVRDILSEAQGRIE
jgi:hypothetical protein